MNLLRMLWRQSSEWDIPTRAAILIALMLLLVMLGVYTLGGDVMRTPAVVGFITLLMVIQGAVLWGNRHMVTPFTRAQRLYLGGDVEAARALLEARRDEPDVDVQELTLLGNIYRQLGQLDTSQRILYEALDISPLHHFPMYGLGRTLLAQGEYDTAASWIEQALAQGAPDVIKSDYAEVLLRAGQQDAARAMLTELDTSQLEASRAVMVAYLRHQLDMPPLTVTPQDAQAGLAYWHAAAGRFAHTPYGAALQQDIDAIKALVLVHGG